MGDRDETGLVSYCFFRQRKDLTFIKEGEVLLRFTVDFHKTRHEPWVSRESFTGEGRLWTGTVVDLVLTGGRI